MKILFKNKNHIMTSTKSLFNILYDPNNQDHIYDINKVKKQNIKEIHIFDL
jgi:hypothetical protein